MLPPGKSKGGVNDSAFYQITLVLVLYPVCLVVLSPTPLCRFCDEVCRLGFCWWKLSYWNTGFIGCVSALL